jgi:threonine/homoserine/homoserine lactone efflux protein
MAEAIGEVLLPALGVALSPFPIVAVILILTSGRGRAKGVAFALGWVVGLASLVGVLLLIAGWIGIEPTKDGPSTVASIVRLALGIGLLALAAGKWRSRPRPGETPPIPAWMDSIKRANPLNALVIGLGLSGLNPKNLMFNLSAGTAIASATSSPREEVIAWGVYIILASLTVLGPVCWYLVSPASAAPRLDQPRQWLITHSTAMVALTVLLIGVSQIGKGIAGLG